MSCGARQLRRAFSTGLLAALLIAMSFLGAGPARAGGWWNSIELGAPLWAPGMSVQVQAGDAWFPSRKAAERAHRDGSYQAYLLEGFDYAIVDRALAHDFRPRWWELGDARAIHLGPVVLARPGANLVDATARFEVPEVAPGRYEVMFCNDGCTRSFADVIPTTVTIIEDRVVAELSRRVERMSDRAEEIESSLHTRMWRLKKRVHRLAKAVREHPVPEPESDAAAPTGEFSGGTPILLGSTGALALAGAVLLWRRRARSPG